MLLNPCFCCGPLGVPASPSFRMLPSSGESSPSFDATLGDPSAETLVSSFLRISMWRANSLLCFRPSPILLRLPPRSLPARPTAP